MQLADRSEEVDERSSDEVLPSQYESLVHTQSFLDHLDSLNDVRITNVLDQIKRTNDYLKRIGPEM